MSQDSTGRIFGVALAVCAACSVVVSGAAVSLKPRQEQNAIVDQQKQVLGVAGLLEAEDAATVTAAEVTDLFQKNIVPKVINLKTGAYDDSVDPKTFDQATAPTSDAPENKAKVKKLPEQALVYQIQAGDKVERVVLPIEGAGLWGTLYGYMAVESDGQTIAGLTFYKHQETPGLGGEVDNPNWKSLWKGRKIYGEDSQPKIEVKKGAAGPVADDPYSVDGLSGATITSRGVTDLVQFWLGESGYAPYLNALKAGKEG